MARNDDDYVCLHCKLAKVMEAYMEQYGCEDSGVLFAALADIIADLLANTEQMFAARDTIMAGITKRAFERAQDFLDEEKNQRLN
jgi:hypothetical protein